MKHLLAASIAAFGLFAGTSVVQAATADIVFVVDESGSMDEEHEFLEQLIPDLSDALALEGITASFAVIGFGGIPATPRTVRDFGNAYETVSDSNTAGGNLNLSSINDDLSENNDCTTNQLCLPGGFEDGYAAMGYALDNLTYSGDATNFILVTDEDRDNLTGFEAYDTYALMLAALTGNEVILNAVVDIDLTGQALGFDGTDSFNPSASCGEFTTAAGGDQIGGFGSTEAHYGDLAIATGGAVWDLKQLRAGGCTAESFASAFINIKVKEIKDQVNPIPLPAAAWLLLAGVGGLAYVGRMKRA